MNRSRRISQVEQKIDGLVASLVNPPATQFTACTTPAPASVPVERGCSSRIGGDFALQANREGRPVAPGNWLPFPSSFEQHPEPSETPAEHAEENEDAADRHYIEQIRSIHNFGDSGEHAQNPGNLFRASKRRDETIEDDLIGTLLASGEADTLLYEYRKMSNSFPFVPLASNVSAEHLHQTAPMLFLAMITAASWREHQRQMALDAIYRQELAHRTIIRPRRNLSLVQSVLVYLSW